MTSLARVPPRLRSQGSAALGSLETARLPQSSVTGSIINSVRIRTEAGF
jgi:hypothetical protein